MKVFGYCLIVDSPDSKVRTPLGLGLKIGQDHVLKERKYCHRKHLVCSPNM